MSISDGLVPSIFCRKMEKARPLRAKMDGKVVYFPPESALLPLNFILFDSTFPYLYLDSACKHLWKYNVRTFQNLLRERLGILLRAFQNFFGTLKNCIESSSERVYNFYWLIVLTIFNQSSFIPHLFFTSQYWYCKPPIWLSNKKTVNY